MAIGAPYATLPDFTLRFPEKLAESRIDRALTSATREIEARTNRCFNIDTSVVTRTFVGDGSGCLKLTDDPDNPLCPGIATAVGLIVKLDTLRNLTYPVTLVSGTDWELWPPSAPLGPVPRPYTELRMVNAYGLTSSLYSSWWAKYRVQVTAKFGYPNGVPATIRDGCVELAAIDLGVSTEDRDAILSEKIDIHGPGLVVA